MEAIDLIMKIWGIHDQYRKDVEDILKNSKPEYLGLKLAMLAQPADEDDTDTETENWMATYLPEIQFR